MYAVLGKDILAPASSIYFLYWSYIEDSFQFLRLWTVEWSEKTEFQGSVQDVALQLARLDTERSWEHLAAQAVYEPNLSPGTTPPVPSPPGPREIETPLISGTLI